MCTNSTCNGMENEREREKERRERERERERGRETGRLRNSHKLLEAGNAKKELSYSDMTACPTIRILSECAGFSTCYYHVMLVKS